MSKAKRPEIQIAASKRLVHHEVSCVLKDQDDFKESVELVEFPVNIATNNPMMNADSRLPGLDVILSNGLVLAVVFEEEYLESKQSRDRVFQNLSMTRNTVLSSLIPKLANWVAGSSKTRGKHSDQLVDNSNKWIVLIQGEYKTTPYETNAAYDIMMEFQTRIASLLDVSIFLFQDAAHLARLIILLERVVYSASSTLITSTATAVGRPSPSSSKQQVPSSLSPVGSTESAIEMLTRIPGIKSSVANTLIESYSLKGISEMGVSELMKNRGIGKESAEKIYSFMNQDLSHFSR